MLASFFVGVYYVHDNQGVGLKGGAIPLGSSMHVAVFRVEEVSIGTEKVESSSYSVSHSCLHALVCKN